MAAAAAPPPIVGTSIDPPPREVPRYAERLDRTAAGGIGYRAMRRYTYAHVGLLSAGTAYYLFLSLFSLLTVAYGVIAIVEADRLAQVLNDALDNALPGLVGDDGIDPDQLRSTGSTAGLVGLVFLLYSGLGAIGGASSSMHLIFGAPPDPRSFVNAKARHLLVLIMIAPLVVVSFGSASLASSLIRPALEAIGWDPAPSGSADLGRPGRGIRRGRVDPVDLAGSTWRHPPPSTSASDRQPHRCGGRRGDQATAGGHRRVVSGQAAVRCVRRTPGRPLRPVPADDRALRVCGARGGHQ